MTSIFKSFKSSKKFKMSNLWVFGTIASLIVAILLSGCTGSGGTRILQIQADRKMPVR